MLKMNHPVHWYLENNVLDHLKRNGHFVKGVIILTKTEMVKEILQAGSACQELKTAAQNYLDAVGTADEQDKAETLVAECEADVMKCADVIVFMKTDAEKNISEQKWQQEFLPMKRNFCQKASNTAIVLDAQQAKE